MPMEPLLPTFWRAQNNHIELGSDLNQNEKCFFSNGVICVVAEVNVDRSSKPCNLWESSPQSHFRNIVCQVSKEHLRVIYFCVNKGGFVSLDPFLNLSQ